MKKLFTLVMLSAVLTARSQSSETHNFVTYDTTYNGTYGSWLLRISRPANMFVAGNADTASRPAIITMPGVGEQGSTNTNNLVTYGPHWWLNNGWDGSVVLGNGTHYPILVTVSFINNPYPSPEGGADVLAFLLKTYHIKRNSVHLGGLSQGAFVWTSMIAFEQTAGDETGMKMVTSLTALEGFSLGQDAPYSSWARGDVAYQVWASKYHGKYFGLEGTADYRNVAEGEKAMNAVAPGSAHFSYETAGGGGHCCWNSMYDPTQHNWQSFPAYGPLVAAGTDTNSRGTYQIGSSVFQWMLRQGDTTLVGSAAPPTGPSQPLGVYVPIPATIQAEAYNNMFGVATEATADAGGGQDVGQIDYADYMDYNIYAPAAGIYTVNFRVATSYAGCTMQLQNSSGKLLAGIAIPNTGGFQNWTTVSTTVTLPAGNQTVRIYNNSWTHWNINWIQFVSGGSNGKSIPGTIQAESYDDMSGVATENTADVNGGLDVGWIDEGDWMSYNVNVAAAGVYTVSFRVATSYAGSTLQLQDATGKALVGVNIPNTGDFQKWATVSATVSLPAGSQSLRIYNNSWTHWNINWMQFVSGTTNAVGQQVVDAQARMLGGDSSVGMVAEHFTVYPNPARDRVTLDISNAHMGKVKVQVLSPSGVLVQATELDKTSTLLQVPLSVSGLASGVYFIRVQGVDWFETKKVEKW